MLRYLLKRVLLAIPLLLGIATVLFFVLHLAPGDPTSTLFGPNVSEQAVEQLRRNWGLDQPMHVQYVKWLGAVLTGDLGYSFTRNTPVSTLLLRILPNTLVLSGAALVLAFAGGIALGIVQALKRNTLVDSVLSAVSLFFYSMPSFWLALMMILVFSLFAGTVWDWPFSFPPSGMVSPDHDLMGFWDRLGDRIAHLVLPATTLALVLAAGLARYVRGSMLEVMGQDYVRTARAKGLPERTVIVRHVLRNALIPVVTLVGLYLPFLFSGAVFVEVVFSWPGMGKLMVDAITQRDYPVVLGGGLLFAGIVVAGNVVADLLYRVVDPRIRYDGGA